ncbi:MAG: methionyl-tRNA formyltransferase [Solirubrobacterales bacterium]
MTIARPSRRADLRVVYLGTSEFAVAVLNRLADSPFRPVLVITPPDRPKGRGRRVGAPPAALAARELDLPLHQADSVNRPEAVDAVRAASAERGVVCAFGQLISEPLLSELPMLNVHPSLLPRWRGAAPIERTIMAGDGETGVTIIQVAAGFDSGPMALRERVEIEPRDDYGSLSDRLAKLGGKLIVRALELDAAGELQFAEQDEAEVTYAEKITAADRRLDPGRPAVELARAVRALNPHIGAGLDLEGGGRLRVRGATAEPGELDPGALVAEGGVLRLGCAEGALRIEEVQPAGGRPMAAEAYLRGHPAPRLAS